MITELKTLFIEHRRTLYLLCQQFYTHEDSPFLLRSDLHQLFDLFIQTEQGQLLKDSAVEELFCSLQEASKNEPWIYLAARSTIGHWNYYRLHSEEIEIDEIDVSEYLEFKERLVGYEAPSDEYLLELDMTPFNREFPKLQEARSIGRGVEFLNRHLSSKLFVEKREGSRKILDFLRVHQHRSTQLMLNGMIEDVPGLQAALRKGVKFLKNCDEDTCWDDVAPTMMSYGFQPGWGRTLEDILEMFHMLMDILEAPDPQNLEKFLGRIPMIFSIVVVSPHGYFGQENVLGLPDTGGQVVYILDQVRALEKEMKEQIYRQGLDIEPSIVVLTRLIPHCGDTSCNQPEEQIAGTSNATIIRVPFRNDQGEVINDWISRFKIWPHLERFSRESERKLLETIGARPDLIIGNYSDGNLVSFLLSRRLRVTQCTIAHALEKAKYLFSGLYWKENPEYNFQTQFTADLVSMNAADFIITSTYQEIAGTDESLGQYESYSSFTMPALYRVINGINIYDPKFNIVSPGADDRVYFPYYDEENRLTELHDELHELIYGDHMEGSRGLLDDKDKPLIFTMARLDKVKNITGLVECYAKSERLREQANLLVVAGSIHVDHSSDAEERYQIETMHRLFDEYQLDGQVRWLGKHLQKNKAGELYRYIADQKGVFVQPALFEAFGLTVIEAMATGLPIFATQYGGPLEIIVDGKSGFHIDPNDNEEMAEKICTFFERAANHPQYWKVISDACITRVEENYTWSLYARRLLTLSRVYGFWKYVSNLEREETRRYLEMFHGLMFRNLASETQ